MLRTGQPGSIGEGVLEVDCLAAWAQQRLRSTAIVPPIAGSLQNEQRLLVDGYGGSEAERVGAGRGAAECLPAGPLSDPGQVEA